MFTCAFNGPRDDWQVPLALHERGLLAHVVSDLCLPSFPPLPGALGRRQVAVPLRCLRPQPSLFLENLRWQVGGRRDGANHFARIDAQLSRAALENAVRSGSQLFLYSRYAAPAFSDPRAADLRKGLFVFHTFEPFTRRLLIEDAARHPELNLALGDELEFSDTARDADLEFEWRAADFIACASQFTRRSLVESGCDPRKIRVIPYGFSVENEFDPAAKDGGPTRFLFVGQGVQRKGLHHLLKAWAANRPGDATLTCVCYRVDPAIARLASPGVTLLGRQSPEALARLFREAHAFVLPSLAEGFGLVLLEALAAGCHVIASRSTGLVDLQPTTDQGTLFDAGDLDALTQALHAVDERRRGENLDFEASAELAHAQPWERFRTAIADYAEEALHG